MQQFRWVQDLLEILENSAAPDEFLENTKLELYQDQVFCFTPKGQLIQLPRGATPVDFAYAVHSQVGDTCVGAKVNGRLMPLRYQLQNGDQVEIMTARGGTPSPQWERFVVTGKARARIRRFVHQQQREAAPRMSGGPSWPRRSAQAGVDGSEKVLEPALKALKFAERRRPLHRGRQRQPVGARDVVHAAYPELRQAPRAPRMVPALPPRGRAGGGPTPSMPITGLVPGMAYHFAGCCHPVPGDDIVGIVATGKGVTIHARDCQTLEAFAATPERFIDVDWNMKCWQRASPMASAAGPYRADQRDRRQRGRRARQHDQRDRQAGRRDREFEDRQPPAGFHGDAGRRRRARLSHLSKVIAGLRGVNGVKGVERAKA